VPDHSTVPVRVDGLSGVSAVNGATGSGYALVPWFARAGVPHAPVRDVRRQARMSCSARALRASATESKPALIQSPVISMTLSAYVPLIVSVVW
jgi:hypothetical protein